METPRNETEAFLALLATAYDAAVRSVTGESKRVLTIAADREAEPVPIRRPGEARPVPIETPNRPEDVKPGMRQIGGRWFYSAAWL